MHKLKIILFLVSLLSFREISSDKDDGDDGKAYEFGFTIEGQQHRHESRDINGIVQGEFGFITADGYYHTTVYATDENGSFKILSMRSVRVSDPLDQLEAAKYAHKNHSSAVHRPSTPTSGFVPTGGNPGPSGFAPTGTNQVQNNPVFSQGPVTQVQGPPPTTGRPHYVFTTQPTVKPACSGCGIPTSTRKPSAGLDFQNPLFQGGQNEQYPGQSNYPSSTPFNDLLPPSHSPSVGLSGNYNPGPTQTSGFPGVHNDLSNNNVFNPGQNVLGSVGGFPNTNFQNPPNTINVFTDNRDSNHGFPISGSVPNLPSPGVSSPNSPGVSFPNSPGTNVGFPDSNYPGPNTGSNNNPGSVNTGNVQTNYPGTGFNNSPGSVNTGNLNNNNPGSDLNNNPGFVNTGNVQTNYPGSGFNNSPGSVNTENVHNNNPGSDFNNNPGFVNTGNVHNNNPGSGGVFPGSNYPGSNTGTVVDFPGSDYPGSNTGSHNNPSNLNTGNYSPTSTYPGQDSGFNNHQSGNPGGSPNYQNPNLPPISPTPGSNIDGLTITGGVINIPNNPSIPIKDKYPGMFEGLPDGVEQSDVEDLLYKFNYTVGFHGHYEQGYKNGAKIGGYYVNGRDGFSRVVTYVADENGYRPKVKLINLGLDSPDTPKEDTEKTFGLKHFEFIWYPIR